MPPGHDAGDVTSAFEFVFAPIISALDDPITTMTTAAEEVGSPRHRGRALPYLRRCGFRRAFD